MTDFPTKPILHTKRGTTYLEVFNKAVIESEGPLSKHWTVYIADHNGQVWLRPSTEMRENNSDGIKRFISLAASAAKDAQILETLIINIDRGRPPKERWRHAQSLLNLGQEEAIILCMRFNLDPYKIVGDTP